MLAAVDAWPLDEGAQDGAALETEHQTGNEGVLRANLLLLLRKARLGRTEDGQIDIHQQLRVAGSG